MSIAEEYGLEPELATAAKSMGLGYTKAGGFWQLLTRGCGLHQHQRTVAMRAPQHLPVPVAFVHSCTPSLLRQGTSMQCRR